MPSVIQGYYDKATWDFAFLGNNSKIVFDAEGNVYKDSISFGNLVVSNTGVPGVAGYNSSGEVTIFSNPDSNNGVQALVATGIGAASVSGGDSGANNYVYFAVRTDNVARTVSLFINGQLVATSNLPQNLTPFDVVRRAMIGGYVDLEDDTNQFQGKIEDFRIYREVLTDQDISDVYDWGRQKLQFQKLTYVPPKGYSVGCNMSLKIHSDTKMTLRALALEYQERNLR